MSEADMYVTFYGKGFDLKWMNSKFLQYGLPVLAETPHVDLFWIAKSNLNLSRKSLDNLTKFLGLANKKFYVSGAIWQKARIGDPAALDKVVKHCYADVVITEQAYLKLRPFARQHPRVNGYWSCRACGGSSLQRRGYELTTTKGRMCRFKCNECGAWSRYPEQDAEAMEKSEVAT